MFYYVLRRLVYVVFVFFIISLIMFGIFQLVPGDRARLMVDYSIAMSNPELYKIMYEQAREDLGLDLPIYQQYLKWMGGILAGNFGYSSHYKTDVINVVEIPMKNTIQMNLINLVLVFAITIPLGIATAVRKGSLFDSTTQIFTIVGISLPGFLVALICICFFAVLIPIFPISGSASAGAAIKGWSSLRYFIDRLYHMALPLIVLTITSMARLTRYVRSSMIEQLRQDYVRTARAKGLNEKIVIYSHAFRNSLIPVVTVMTGWFIGVFGGSVVIESIFLWNGIGNLLYQSLMRQDYAVVLAMNMFYAVLALLGNLLMDLMYGVVDPRVKLS